jgi:hypothetical protein
LGDELAGIGIAGKADLLSMFLTGPRGTRAWARGAPVLTDDHPFLEFSSARKLRNVSYASFIRSVSEHLEDPATYREGDEDAAYRDAVSVRDCLLKMSELKPGHDFEQRVATLEAGISAAPVSRRLARFYRAEIIAWASSDPIKARGPRSAMRIYMRGLRHLPDFGEAAALLAIQFAREGNLDEAIDLLQRYEGIERSRPVVQEILEDLLRRRAAGNNPP